MSRAASKGFYYGNQEWANLGQGAPETGAIDSLDSRLESIEVDPCSSEYSPVVGDLELRKAVAKLYNTRYRSHHSSKYTEDNVAIASGGRVALTRIAASLGSVNLGHFLPDYTAYEELFDIFKAFVPIPVVLRKEDQFRVTPELVENEIVSRGLGAMLLSNPSNPTGQLLAAEQLDYVVDLARRLSCSMIFDEFYSHYVYRDDFLGKSVSAAEHVEDVDLDPVIIVDGLTKNWRYPGLRLSWTLGPKSLISKLASAGSFLDGGAAHPIQKAALNLVDPKVANAQVVQIQKYFKEKRDYMHTSLEELGFELLASTQGAFYCWANLDKLPFDGAMDFFEKALEKKVICVPGEFFDVNPGKRRSHIPSRLRTYVRLSFGPSMPELQRGMLALKELIHSS